MTIAEIVDARKVKIPADKAWDQLKNASIISVAKGKKIVKFDVATDDKDEILKLKEILLKDEVIVF